MHCLDRWRQRATLSARHVAKGQVSAEELRVLHAFWCQIHREERGGREEEEAERKRQIPSLDTALALSPILLLCPEVGTLSGFDMVFLLGVDQVTFPEGI